ncbi:MAG: DUF58 domain-containing protein [Treponema sp.]|nr:DUF58 domain-containing protein [Treponema sp.]
MDTRELLEKIRTIPLNSGRLAEQLLAGNFRSVFRGQGIEFDEMRHYQYGDDIRSIDWNASARFAVPFIKLYREERDLTILILLDTSASMYRDKNFSNRDSSAPSRPTPYEQGVLAAALIAFSAESKSQRVGALLFDRDVHKVFLPRKGRHHLMALVGGILHEEDVVSHNANPGEAKTPYGSNIASALNGAGRLLRRRSMVVLISDFLSIHWEDELSRLCRAHDVIAVRISEPEDENLPAWGLPVIEDPETGVRISAPVHFRSFRQAWKEWHVQRGESWENTCRRTGAEYLDLPVNADAAAELYRFFISGSRGSGAHA